MKDPRRVQRVRLSAACAALFVLTFLCPGALSWAGMCPNATEMEVMDLINLERQQVGLAPLAVELRLVQAARLHSQDMASLNYFDHTSLDGSSPWDRIRRAGYPMAGGAENIAAGYQSPQAVMDGWMNSPGHRANILTATLRHMGVGVAYGPSSRYGIYWTTDFGNSQDAGQLLPDFGDVPVGYWARPFVRLLSCHGITGGCGAGYFCPDMPVTRAQMAVFIETALGVQAPPPCTGSVFGDVNAGTLGPAFCGFIEDFAARGITGGCQSGSYCPHDPVTRGQMAVFLTTALSHAPASACTGMFRDVPQGPFCRFIERFAQLGITSGCGNGSYCPDEPVTRAQMAVFLVNGFGL